MPSLPLTSSFSSSSSSQPTSREINGSGTGSSPTTPPNGISISSSEKVITSDSPDSYSSPISSSSPSSSTGTSISSTSTSSFSSSPSSSSSSSSSSSQLPLRYFVKETLRRSKTSCSVLQTALLYCLKARLTIEASVEFSMKTCQNKSSLEKEIPKNFHPSLLCQRKTFLASLMISSKFLQDRTYSNKAWSKISGLSVLELGEMERNFLKVLDWTLFVREGEWEKWCEERDEKSKGLKFDSPPTIGESQKVNVEEVNQREIKLLCLDRSFSENVGMEIKFDCQVESSSSVLNQDFNSPSDQLNKASSFFESSNSTPIASTSTPTTTTNSISTPNISISRDSNSTLNSPFPFPLPFPISKVHNSTDSEFLKRPKARLPLRARSQLNPLSNSSSISSSPFGFGIGIESLNLSTNSNLINSEEDKKSQHPLSKSLTIVPPSSERDQIETDRIEFEFFSS